MSSELHELSGYVAPEDVLIDNPEKRSRNFNSFSYEDKIYMVLCGSLALFVDLSYGRVFALLVIAFWALTGWIRTDYGRPYQVLWENLRSLKIRWRDSGYLYRAPDKSQSNGSTKLPAPPIPLQVTELGKRGIGMVYNKERNEDSIAVSGRGSDFTMRDPVEKKRMLEDLVEVAKRVAAAYGAYSSSRSLVYCKRPDSLPWREHVIRNTYDPDVVVPAAFGIPEADWSDDDRLYHDLHQSLQQELDLFDIYGRETFQTAVWSIKRKWVPADVVKGKASLAENVAARAPVTKMAQLAHAGLKRCGVVDATLLDKEEWKYILRSALDVANIDEYQRWMMRSPEDPASAILPAHWPYKRIRVGYGAEVADKWWKRKQANWIQTDDTYHAVMVVSGSRAQVQADYFTQLFAADAPFMSIALIGDTIKYGREYFSLSRWIHGYRKAREELGLDEGDPKAERAMAAAQKRLEEILASGFTESYNVLVSISHTSLEVLEDSVQNVIIEASTLNMDLKRIEGETRLLPALISATTGIPMQ